jgi:hypothetical protein
MCVPIGVGRSHPRQSDHARVWSGPDDGTRLMKPSRSAASRSSSTPMFIVRTSGNGTRAASLTQPVRPPLSPPRRSAKKLQVPAPRVPEASVASADPSLHRKLDGVMETLRQRVVVCRFATRAWPKKKAANAAFFGGSAHQPSLRFLRTRAMPANPRPTKANEAGSGVCCVVNELLVEV